MATTTAVGAVTSLETFDNVYDLLDFVSDADTRMWGYGEICTLSDSLAALHNHAMECFQGDHEEVMREALQQSDDPLSSVPCEFLPDGLLITPEVYALYFEHSEIHFGWIEKNREKLERYGIVDDATQHIFECGYITNQDVINIVSGNLFRDFETTPQPEPAQEKLHDFVGGLDVGDITPEMVENLQRHLQLKDGKTFEEYYTEIVEAM